jgi:ABC-2 type transport system permease protein
MPIFDQGYQHWNGELRGNGWRWLAITRHGIRTGLKGKAVRIALLLAWLPALGLAAMLCLWGLLERQSEVVKPFLQGLSFMIGGPAVEAPRAYRVEIWTLSYSYFLLTELRFSMVLVLLLGPGLISQDLRFNAMPLYLSRPIRRVDYFVGKLGVIVALLGMVVVVPSVAAYVLGLAFSLDLSIVRDTFGLLLASVAYGLVIAVSAGMLILALSSLSRNSRYVALMWLAVWFIGGVASTILQEAERDHRRHARLTAMNVAPPPQGDSHAAEAQRRAWRAANQGIWDQLRAEELKAAERDWRPLLSYNANLSRIGHELLDTDAPWRRLAAMRPERERARFMVDNAGWRYPWQWSAWVLVGLFGLSACVLNLRVRSLDRLK